MAVSPPKVFNLKDGFKFGGQAGAGPARVENRIGVQAPAETIWDIVHDIAGWSAWNPLYPEAQGEVRIGAHLALKQALPGRTPEAVDATVLEWVPREQLHWRASVFGGMVRAVHYIEIESLTQASCIVSNGEIYGGLLTGLHLNRNRRALRLGFEAMNDALKIRAEAAFQAARDAPTSGVS